MGIKMDWRELHEDSVPAEELLTVDDFQGWGSQLSSEAWSRVIVYAPVKGLTPKQRQERGHEAGEDLIGYWEEWR